MLVSAGLLGIATAVAGLLRPPLPPLSADRENIKLIKHGQEIYRQQCASCHRAELKGQVNWTQIDGNGLIPAPPPDDCGLIWHHPDGMLFKVTLRAVAGALGMVNYKSSMSAFVNVLTDEKIIATLAFIKSK